MGRSDGRAVELGRDIAGAWAAKEGADEQWFLTPSTHPVGASWDTIGADHVARDAVKLLNSARRLGVSAMNPNLNRRDDGKVLEMMQGQGPRDALTEVQDWALERTAGGRASHPNRR